METIKVAPSTVTRAFAAHVRRYDSQRDWNIGYHVEMWRRAAKAAKSGKLEDFEAIYWDLRNRWQVFRPARTPPTPRRVFGILERVDPALRSWRLSGIADASPRQVISIWGALTAASPIKVNKGGPSVMAVSKFLHFWNPRLFVIVDAEVMRDLVFGHAWLNRDFERVRRELVRKVPSLATSAYFAGELGTYLAALFWAARLLGAHPTLMPAFQAHLERDASRRGERVPACASSVEAAAAEWLLLGLVELPPAGVTVPEVEGERP